MKWTQLSCTRRVDVEVFSRHRLWSSENVNPDHFAALNSNWSDSSGGLPKPRHQQLCAEQTARGFEAIRNPDVINRYCIRWCVGPACPAPGRTKWGWKSPPKLGSGSTDRTAALFQLGLNYRWEEYRVRVRRMTYNCSLGPTRNPGRYVNKYGVRLSRCQSDLEEVCERTTKS